MELKTSTPSSLSPLNTLNALSPLDGRYATKVAALRPLLSESGFMRHRVKVEIEWLIALSEAGLPELSAFSNQATDALRGIVTGFSDQDALRIKDIEAVTNHDVKAVEYFLKEKVAQIPALSGFTSATEFIHFACTSEDINNTSHGMMITSAREQVLLPAVDELISKLRLIAHTNAAVPMLSRTHGQPASPTTLGKEFANVVARLRNARADIESVAVLAKMNGAVGNYNAHLSAYQQLIGPH